MQGKPHGNNKMRQAVPRKLDVRNSPVRENSFPGALQRVQLVFSFGRADRLAKRRRSSLFLEIGSSFRSTNKLKNRLQAEFKFP